MCVKPPLGENYFCFKSFLKNQILMEVLQVQMYDRIFPLVNLYKTEMRTFKKGCIF